MQNIFNLTHNEFLTQFGPERIKLVKDEAARLADEVTAVKERRQLKPTNRQFRRFVVTQALFRLIEDRQEWIGNERALEAFNLKELYDPAKWWLLNPVYFITEGALRLLWDQDHKGKATQFFAGDGNKYGQSNNIVKEHVYTTSVAKQRTFDKGFRTLHQLAYYVAQRTILSFTAANEDVKLEKADMSDKDNFFCRYDDVELKTVPLAAKWRKYGRDSVLDKLAADAAQARVHGVSFEDWASEVIAF